MADTENTTNICKVIIAPDKMSASITLYPKSDNSFWLDTEIYDLLRINGVSFGYDYDMISKLTENQLYGIPVTVAKGKPCENGKDGYYTYNFRTIVSRKPAILPDGSVDYRAMENFETVSAGTEIAYYHPATEGTDGQDVRGAALKAKNGKELLPLKGNGFKRSEDNLVYTAVISGKIVLKNDSIEITNVLEIPGDVDLSYGNIDFDGSIIVHGVIYSGISISTTGDIYVDGNVEAVNLKAGGNIELKSGMQGNGKGRIDCHGNLSGKFFESVTINVGGCLNANSLLNCVSEVRGVITISGKHGAIIGGSTTSISGIKATTVGNLTELSTNITAGISSKFSDMLMEIDRQISEINDRIHKLDIVMMQIIKIQNPTNREKFEQKRSLVQNSKNELMRQYSEIQKEKNDLLRQAKASSYATISIAKTLHPGVNVCINGIRLLIKHPKTGVTLAVDSENQLVWHDQMQ